MIDFLDKTDKKIKPFKLLEDFYDKAVESQQIIPEAMSISSFDSKNNFVDSRYVNLKYIKDNKLIFFSNYNSKKAQQFDECNKRLITALIYWNSINTQIRIRGKISKMDFKLSNEYFKNRSKDKNALAIASNQSKEIESYEVFLDKYKKTLDSVDLSVRPDYWGGYEISPKYFEFWEGHDARINKRMVLELKNGDWKEYYLEP